VGGKRFTASPSLLGSKLVKKGHGGIPLREAALVGGALFHPALGVEFFEDISNLPLHHRDVQSLQSVFLDCFAAWDGDEDHPSAEKVLQEIEKRQLNMALDQVKSLLLANNLWQLLPNAAFEDARDGWLQAYTLHLKNQTLNRELKTAERALADDDSQENLERLLHIQEELSRSDGVEALIDGFGVPSGRSHKGF